MPGAVIRKPILKVKTITEQELRQDWLGMLSPFVDLKERTLRLISSLKIEEKLLSQMKTVMGKKLKNKNLLEESFQITDLLDADKDKSAPQLSIEQKKLLLKEVKTAFKDSGKKKEEEVISLPPPPEAEVENTVFSKEKLVTKKEILSFEDLSFLPQIKELESNYPRLLCLINEVSRLLQLFTENILSSEWAKKSNELRNEGLPASLREHRSETEWGMNEISPRLPEPKPKPKNV